MSQPPKNHTDKALRPYCVSIDWLQVFCHTTSYFNAEGTSPWGYSLLKKDYGSKFWKNIYDVYAPDGALIGQLATTPHRKDINQASCMFKVENYLLYEADALDRVYAAIDGLGLKYKGISRIDLAYDCNELYNGLSVENLIQRYLYEKDGKRYLKCGQNRPLVFFDLCYHASEASDGVRMYSNKPARNKREAKAIADDYEQRAADCAAVGMPAPDKQVPVPLKSAAAPVVGSITWGVRSQSVQVQIYDKSREMREVKMKHHIVNAWKNAGLDITRPVYRLEIRITNRGKMLQNVQTGKYYNLSALDILTQQQVEQMYNDYAEKYLKFYIQDEHVKLQNMQRLRILSLCNSVVVRPRSMTRGQDIARTAAITLKQLKRDIDEQAKDNSASVAVLSAAKQHIERAIQTCNGAPNEELIPSDSTRSTKIALNELDKHIVANIKEGNEVSNALRIARDYIERTYDLRQQQSKWMSKDLAMARLSAGEYETVDAKTYFEERLKGASDELAAIAARAHADLMQYVDARRSEAADEDFYKEQRHEQFIARGGTEEAWTNMQREREEDGVWREFDPGAMTHTFEKVKFEEWLTQQQSAMRAYKQELLRHPLDNMTQEEYDRMCVSVKVSTEERARELRQRRKDERDFLEIQQVADCPF